MQRYRTTAEHGYTDACLDRINDIRMRLNQNDPANICLLRKLKMLAHASKLKMLSHFFQLYTTLYS